MAHSEDKSLPGLLFAVSEDIFNKENKYSWSKDSGICLEDFLKKYKPSMVQNDGTKPWIWVKRCDPEKAPQGMEGALKEAEELLKTVTEKVEAIKNDSSIPLRSNKKTGAKSKKEVREAVQAEATKNLTDIAQKHDSPCGKWLIFAPPNKVDSLWQSLATSLISGPLASTSAFGAKVSTSQHDNPNYQHVICVYIPNVYDKESVTEVMRILLRNHGATLSGVKSDLYTALGIDSKHSSGLQSTIWKAGALMKDAEMKELKDEYFAEISSKIAENLTVEKEESMKKDTIVPSKLKPKLKKATDDPFASEDDNDDQKEEERKREVKSKIASRQSKVDIEGDEANEADAEPQVEIGTRALKSKKSDLQKMGSNKNSAKSKRAMDIDYSSEEQKPKKKAARR